MENTLKEYRCINCNKLLFKGLLVDAEVEVKCKSCHGFTHVHENKSKIFLCMIENCPNRVPMGK